MLNFKLTNLLVWASVIAVFVFVVQFPLALIAIGCSYAVIRISPLKNETMLTTFFHNGVLGFMVAAFVSVFIIVFATPPRDAAPARFPHYLGTTLLVSALASMVYGYFQVSAVKGPGDHRHG